MVYAETGDWLIAKQNRIFHICISRPMFDIRVQRCVGDSHYQLSCKNTLLPTTTMHKQPKMNTGGGKRRGVGLQLMRKQRSGADGDGGAGDYVAVTARGDGSEATATTDVDGIVALAAANKAAARKEKSSRRTTSLLNIFMSNSQGKGSLFFFYHSSSSTFDGGEPNNPPNKDTLLRNTHKYTATHSLTTLLLSSTKRQLFLIWREGVIISH